MVVTISPLDLVLDEENPRFVILDNRNQSSIRKYLATYEDVCELTSGINSYGGLLPGERVVALKIGESYVVAEGNRRTCSLQFLLSRDLIPSGFEHRIPHASEEVLKNCSSIEIDILPNRDAALELMTKRHIEGVKQWKPLAKKQFFASNYNDGRGISIPELSKITSISESKIKEDIRDYKFFHSIFEKYSICHPEFDREIISLKTDPFWRIFKAKFEYPTGSPSSPKEFFQITYDDTLNTISDIDQSAFEEIALLVFEKAIVEEAINTRSALTDIEGMDSLLQAFREKRTVSESFNPNEQDNPTGKDAEGCVEETTSSDTESNKQPNNPSNDATASAASNNGRAEAGGPQPGGPQPRSFFESLSWHDKLHPDNPEHSGLLCAVSELHALSIKSTDRKKSYVVYPIATGMILRTAYEQALRLRISQTNLWGAYMKSISGRLPTLGTMEDFVRAGKNKPIVFPDKKMTLAFDRVVAASQRDFLNANIHYPANIRVAPSSLEALAQGGMLALIQGIINLI